MQVQTQQIRIFDRLSAAGNYGATFRGVKLSHTYSSRSPSLGYLAFMPPSSLFGSVVLSAEEDYLYIR